jgi:hypothetical protein
VEIGREAVKPADRIRVPIRPDRHVVHAVADVDPRGVGMHHLKAGIGGLQAASQFSALLAVQP